MGSIGWLCEFSIESLYVGLEFMRSFRVGCGCAKARDNLGSDKTKFGRDFVVIARSLKTGAQISLARKRAYVRYRSTCM